MGVPVRWMAVCLLGLCLANLSAAHAQKLAVRKDPDGVQVTDGQRDVLFYRTVPDAGVYRRAGYLHPLVGFDGGVLTESAPADHPYQHGIYWAWHQLLLGDEPVANGWTCEDINWVVRNVRVRKKGGAVRLSARVGWDVQLHGAQRRLVNEHTAVTVYPAQQHYRVIDLSITLKSPFPDFRLGGADNEKGYGGLSLRLKDPDQLAFFSATGQVAPKETPVTADGWVDFRKLTNPQANGVVVMIHPDGPDHKGQWILRNTASMQNPVFPGGSPVYVPSAGITLRYRLVVYGGEFDVSLIPSLYQQYLSKGL